MGLWLAGEPVSAHREPLAERARRWIRKHQTFVSGAVASMVIAVLSLGALAYQRNQANAVLYAANTRAPRSSTNRPATRFDPITREPVSI